MSTQKSGQVIRILRSADRGLYKQLRLQSLQEEPLVFARDHKEEVDLPDQHWKEIFLNRTIFGCFFENELVGFVGVKQRSALRTCHTADILGMYVARAVRKNKIGEQLMLAVIEYVQTNLPQVKKLSLIVNAEKRHSVAFYMHMGFKVAAILPEELCIDGAYYDEYIMQRSV